MNPIRIKFMVCLRTNNTILTVITPHSNPSYILEDFDETVHKRAEEQLSTKMLNMRAKMRAKLQRENRIY
jgi:hypothetical protein